MVGPHTNKASDDRIFNMVKRRRVTFASPKQPRRNKTQHELTTERIFHALDRESKVLCKNVHTRAQSHHRSSPRLHLDSFGPRNGDLARPGIYPPHRPVSPKKPSRKSLLLIHRPTPLFVRKLAEKFRADVHFNSRVSHLHKSHHNLASSLHATREFDEWQSRRAAEIFAQNNFRTNVTAVNPHNMDLSSSVAEIQQLVKNNRGSQYITQASIGQDKILTESVWYANQHLRIPVLNFKQRSIIQRFKTARNNPENLFGIILGNNMAREPIVRVPEWTCVSRFAPHTNFSGHPYNHKPTSSLTKSPSHKRFCLWNLAPLRNIRLERINFSAGATPTLPPYKRLDGRRPHKFLTYNLT